jgi:hypothetical protein
VATGYVGAGQLNAHGDDAGEVPGPNDRVIQTAEALQYLARPLQLGVEHHPPAYAKTTLEVVGQDIRPFGAGYLGYETEVPEIHGQDRNIAAGQTAGTVQQGAVSP